MRHWLLIFGTVLLSGCASVAVQEDLSDGASANNAEPPKSAGELLAESGWARSSVGSTPAGVLGSLRLLAGLQTDIGVYQGPWRHFKLPGKRATVYRPQWLDGRESLAANASSSASVVRRDIRVAPEQLGRLKFSWRVAALIAGADLAQRESGDSPVRIVLAFEGDRSKFSPRDALLSELAHAISGEPMPYATLMYVWCNRQTTESVIVNPRTDRIRKIVVESGGGNLNRWLDYERDIRADFERAFGEPPGALVAVGVMTDTDNTRSQAQAWYGPVRVFHRLRSN